MSGARMMVASIVNSENMNLPVDKKFKDYWTKKAKEIVKNRPRNARDMIFK